MLVNTAIIGCGIMGQRMLENMCKHPNYNPTHIWDPRETSCATAKIIAPQAKVEQSAQAAIRKAELVYLACPPIPRKAYALNAAHLGKSIFLEKPLGVDVSESEDLVKVLHTHDVAAVVNFTQAAGRALQEVAQAAEDGSMGDIIGIDIILTYATWPRDWQEGADWLRFRKEGGMTREVLSHFLFFSERILGPLSLDCAMPFYPKDPTLSETALLARLNSSQGQSVNILASVGGAQPDRQELTIKGSRKSRRITDFYLDTVSDGTPFTELYDHPVDPRANSLKAQLDELLLCLQGKPHRLATIDEALRVQKLVERMLMN